MFGSSVPGRLPLIGEQFGQAALGMITDAGEDVAQVGEGVDRHSLAGGDQTVQNRRRATAVVAPQEGPISPTYRNSAQTPLGAGMPTSGLCRAISPPTDSERVSAALIVADAA